MMICAIYKSSKKADTYLYLAKRDDFASIPPSLRTIFGTPIFVMLLPVTKVKQLANAELERVVTELTEKGFYLQLPPPTEDLLKVHRQQLGLEDQAV